MNTTPRTFTLKYGLRFGCLSNVIVLNLVGAGTMIHIFLSSWKLAMTKTQMFGRFARLHYSGFSPKVGDNLICPS